MKTFFIRFFVAVLLVGVSGGCSEFRDLKDWSPVFGSHSYPENPLDSEYFDMLCQRQMRDSVVENYTVKSHTVDSDCVADSADSASYEEVSDDNSTEVETYQQTVYDTIIEKAIVCSHHGFGVNLDENKVRISDRNFLLMSSGTLKIDSKEIRRGINNGRRMIFAAEGFMTDKGREAKMNGYVYNIDTLIKHSKNKYPLKTISEKIRTKEDYKFPTVFCDRAFNNTKLERELANLFFPDLNYKSFKVVATTDNGVLACVFKFSNGATVGFVTSPYLFTNYSFAFRRGRTNSLSMALLWQMGLEDGKQKNRLRPFSRYYYPHKWENAVLKGRHEVYPVERVTHNYDDNKSIWERFSSEILFAIVCCAIFIPFVLFRRRQRIIPPATGYVNRSADYVRRVGRLFFNHNEFDALLMKKRNFFYSEIKERLHIELGDTEQLDFNAMLLSNAINSDEDLRPLLKTLNSHIGKNIDKQQFNEICLKINDILNILKGVNTDKNKQLE